MARIGPLARFLSDLGLDAMAMQTETARKADFAANPGFSDYLVTMLEDLQFYEAGETRDTGTIYTLNDRDYAKLRSEYQAFVDAHRADVEAFEDECGWESFGSTLYMVRVGHGVGFTDRTDFECAERLDEAARADAWRTEGAYFGDDGKVCCEMPTSRQSGDGIMRVIVTPVAGAPRYLKVSRTNSSDVRQPFDGVVLERPDDYMPWQTCSDVIAHEMAERVRKACPLASVTVGV